MLHISYIKLQILYFILAKKPKIYELEMRCAFFIARLIIRPFSASEMVLFGSATLHVARHPLASKVVLSGSVTLHGTMCRAGLVCFSRAISKVTSHDVPWNREN